MLADWPFTLLAIMPTDKRLKMIGLEMARPMTRALLVSWRTLHATRSVLDVVSTILFAAALAVTA